ncbi:MAG: hypothetical protein RL346_1673 [Verrucomicrobiota bacterium]|jgi:DUF1365 family protein
MTNENSIYECVVTHTRISPKTHAFTYRVFMLSIDPDHPPRVPLLSSNRFNLFSIDKRDHINTDPNATIRQNLAAWLSENGTAMPTDAIIRLVTFPRVLGYSFNPVSFYYIYRKNGDPLTAVAEVTNTYREMKLYPLGEPSAQGDFNRTIPKSFYVSPFSDPNDTFHFRVGQPSETWTVHIDNLTDSKPNLLSAIRGKRHPITTSRLAWFAVKYPLISLSIILRIHLHALLLYLKNIPHFAKSTPIVAIEPSGMAVQPAADEISSNRADPTNGCTLSKL